MQPFTHYTLKWGYKKFKIESWFQSELFRLMRKDGFICFHPESKYGFCLLDGVIIAPSGKIFLMELKVIDAYTFNMSQFEDSQVALMNELTKRGSPHCVAIYSKKLNQYKVVQYSELVEQQNEKGWVLIFNK